MTKTKSNLYPIYYKGRLYEKSECNSAFVAFYKNKKDLYYDNSVCAGNNIHIYPNGKITVFM